MYVNKKAPVGIFWVFIILLLLAGFVTMPRHDHSSEAIYRPLVVGKLQEHGYAPKTLKLHQCPGEGCNSNDVVWIEGVVGDGKTYTIHVARQSGIVASQVAFSK